MIDIVCKDVIAQLGIQSFVETGTDMGETVAEVARWFAEGDPKFGRIVGYRTTGARGYAFGSQLIRYPVFESVGDSYLKVLSVDNDRRSFETVRAVFGANSNIQLFWENSPDFLEGLIDRRQVTSGKVMFYLDAHWERYWPLRDELKQVLRLDSSVVVIDDFFVPGRSDNSRPHGDFGFDFYAGRILDWAYISDLFSEADIKICYPTCSNPVGRRGFVVLFIGYEPSRLTFMDTLPLEQRDKADPAHSSPFELSRWAYLDLRHMVKSIVPLRLLRLGVRLLQAVTHGLLRRVCRPPERTTYESKS
jgi:hypothetical protein